MLELRNISKKFGDFHLKNVSMRVEKGEYFCVIGVSGAGKSVLLEIIAGIVSPDVGKLFLEGIDISDFPPQKRAIGLVFQDHALFPHMTVRSNIEFPLRCNKTSSNKRKEIVERLSREFNINHLLDRKPETLSGGEQQRVAIARTLAGDPKCILLDEPLSSLDATLKKEVRGLLRKMKDLGYTVIHITHDYEEAVSLADKATVIHAGEVVQTGAIDEIFNAPKSEFVANFTGIRNFIRVEVESSDKLVKRAIADNGAEFMVATDESGVGFLVIRSEDITVSSERPVSSATNLFEGEVLSIEPVPAGVEISIQSGVPLCAKITVSSLNRLEIETGKMVWFSFKAVSVRFIKS